MKAVAERLENNRVSLEIEIDAREVNAALDRAYRKIAGQVSVPGFRKGRVPRVIIEKRYGKEVIQEEALELLVPSAFSDAVRETDIQPIDQPTLTDYEFIDGQPLKLTLVVDVVPEVTLGEAKGLEGERIIEQVDEDDIDHMLEHMVQDHTTLRPAERDVVEEDDYLRIDFVGTIDGVPFDGGAAKDYALRIGSGQFIPGFEEQLIGARVDEPTTVTVTFPEDYAEDLAGKEAEFEVTVKDIQFRHVPELTDEFAEEASNGEHQTMDELRAAIRHNMEEDARGRADEALREQLVRGLVEVSEVDVPEVMLAEERERYFNRLERDVARYGFTLDMYLEAMEKTRESLAEEAEDNLRFNVKASLVLSALAKQEGIAIDDDELQAELDTMVADSGDNPTVLQRIEDEDFREAVRDNMLLRRATDFLVEHAVVEEKEIESQGHGHAHHMGDHEDEADEDDGEDTETVEDTEAVEAEDADATDEEEEDDGA